MTICSKCEDLYENYPMELKDKKVFLSRGNDDKEKVYTISNFGNGVKIIILVPLLLALLQILKNIVICLVYNM